MLTTTHCMQCLAVYRVLEVQYICCPCIGSPIPQLRYKRSALRARSNVSGLVISVVWKTTGLLSSNGGMWWQGTDLGIYLIKSAAFSFEKMCLKISFTTEGLRWINLSNTMMLPLIWLIITLWSSDICINKLTIIGSDNGLAPVKREAIIWTNDGIMLIGPLGTNLSDILIDTHRVSLKKMHLKLSSGKWRPFCLGLNVL